MDGWKITKFSNLLGRLGLFSGAFDVSFRGRVATWNPTADMNFWPKIDIWKDVATSDVCVCKYIYISMY